jgi:hypothetical protein
MSCRHQNPATCDECAAAAAADAWMRDFAAIVWLKAQLLQQTRTVDRAARPMTIVQTVAYGIVAFGWAVLLTWKWSAIEAWAHTLTPSHFVLAATGTTAAQSLTVTFFLVVAALSSATVMLALHTILAED